MLRLFLLMVSYKSHKIYSFFFTLFFLCSSDWMISNDLPLSPVILSSTRSRLRLKLSIEFFSYVIVLQLQISGCISFSISLLKFSFCSCIVFFISLNYSSVFSSNFLSIFQIIIFISLPGNPQIFIFLDHLLEVTMLLW